MGMEGLNIEPRVSREALRALLAEMETNDTSELPMQEAVKYLVEAGLKLRAQKRDDDLLAAKVEGIKLDQHDLHDNSGSETEDSAMGMKGDDNNSNVDIDFDVFQPGDRPDKSHMRFGPFGDPAYEKENDDDLEDNEDSVNEPESSRPRQGATPHTMKFNGVGRKQSPCLAPTSIFMASRTSMSLVAIHGTCPKPATAPEQPRTFEFNAPPPPPPYRAADQPSAGLAEDKVPPATFDGGAFWGTGGGFNVGTNTEGDLGGAGSKGGKKKAKVSSPTPSSSNNSNPFGSDPSDTAGSDLISNDLTK